MPTYYEPRRAFLQYTLHRHSVTVSRLYGGRHRPMGVIMNGPEWPTPRGVNWISAPRREGQVTWYTDIVSRNWYYVHPYGAQKIAWIYQWR